MGALLEASLEPFISLLGTAALHVAFNTRKSLATSVDLSGLGIGCVSYLGIILDFLNCVFCIIIQLFKFSLRVGASLFIGSDVFLILCLICIVLIVDTFFIISVLLLSIIRIDFFERCDVIGVGFLDI